MYRANTTNHLTGGTATASATIGGKALRAKATLLNATVALLIPAHAKGKTLVVRMTVTAPPGRRDTQHVVRHPPNGVRYRSKLIRATVSNS